MVFTSKNQSGLDIDIRINNVCVESVLREHTYCLPVKLERTHRMYMYKIIKICRNTVKNKKNLHKPSLVTLYHSFAYPYLIYCNQVCGNNYPTVINRLVLIQKKLVRIITCCPYRAHTEPLIYTNKMLSVTNLNVYLTGIFTYQCINKEITELFLNFFCTNSDGHDHVPRHSADLYIPYRSLAFKTSVSSFMEQMCGIQYQIKLKIPNLYTCLNSNFAPIWLKSNCLNITMPSVWIII